MRGRALLVMFVGVLLAGVAVVQAHLMIQKPGKQQKAASVIVAKADIEFGQPITAEMLTAESWPADARPLGSFSSLAAVVGDPQSEPRRAKQSLAAGEVLLESKVTKFGEKVTIAQQIDPAMRAVAIRVDDVSGVAGFVGPGDRVDVVLTRTLDRTMQAGTILQNIKVIGIDQNAGKKDNSRPSVVRTVTVEVEPNDVQKVALAQQAGKLSLSLRNLETADTTRLDAITVQDLTNENRPTPVKPVTAELPSVSVNRGGERSSVTVPSG